MSLCLLKVGTANWASLTGVSPTFRFLYSSGAAVDLCSLGQICVEGVWGHPLFCSGALAAATCCLWQSGGGTAAKGGLALPGLTSVLVTEGSSEGVVPPEPLKDVGPFNTLFLFYIFNDFSSLFSCFEGFTSECPNKGERTADWWKMWSAAKTEGRTEPTQPRLDQMSPLYPRF